MSNVIILLMVLVLKKKKKEVRSVNDVAPALPISHRVIFPEQMII